MAYNKNTWATGDVVTSAKLNNIENGVKSINMSYNKNTWATGDVVTSAKLNNIENGIADCDFTTATVTVTNTLDYAGTFYVPVVTEGGADGSCYVAKSGTNTLTVILYNGVASMWSEHMTITSATGSATVEDGEATITGDCTLTIS